MVLSWRPFLVFQKLLSQWSFFIIQNSSNGLPINPRWSHVSILCQLSGYVFMNYCRYYFFHDSCFDFVGVSNVFSGLVLFLIIFTWIHFVWNAQNCKTHLFAGIFIKCSPFCRKKLILRDSATFPDSHIVNQNLQNNMATLCNNLTNHSVRSQPQSLVNIMLDEQGQQVTCTSDATNNIPIPKVTSVWVLKLKYKSVD